MSGSRFEPVHWVGRFLRSIHSRPPSEVDRRWAGGWMSPTEEVLFDAMDDRDRNHSIRVARTVARQTGDRPVVAAALLHDVGKSRAQLGLVGRIAATMVGVLGRRSWTRRFAMQDGYCGRISTYLEYPALGRDMLIDAGSDPLVSSWAAQHHDPPERWSVPIDVGQLLADADR